MFGGLELSGATLNQDNDANKAIYGKTIDAEQILGSQVIETTRVYCQRTLLKLNPLLRRGKLLGDHRTR